MAYDGPWTRCPTCGMGSDFFVDGDCPECNPIACETHEEPDCPSCNPRIHFDDSGNLYLMFEGEWVGWNTQWGQPDNGKTHRFRKAREEAARRITALVNLAPR